MGVLSVCHAMMQGHRYRNVCDLRKGAATSLITVDYTSHTVEESHSNDRVPSGFPYSSVKAKLSELDFIFLNRFIQEILQYVSVMLALRPPAIQQQSQQDSVPALATATGPGAVSASEAAQTHRLEHSSEAVAEGDKAMGAIIQMDIEMEAPVISMPRSSDSEDSLQIDLGFLSLHNSLKWMGGSSPDDPQVSDLHSLLYSDKDFSAVSAHNKTECGTTFVVMLWVCTAPPLPPPASLLDHFATFCVSVVVDCV